MQNFRRSTWATRWLGLVIALSLPASAADLEIRVTSVGFLPTSVKIASVAADAESFEVRRVSDGEVVYDGMLSEPFEDFLSKDVLRTADFSDLDEPGTYTVHVDGVGESTSFLVDDAVYQRAFGTAMLAFYGWRADVDVSFVHEGQAFEHAAAPTGEGFLDELGYEGELADASGGWYDAGDYGRYVVNGAFSAATILRAWEELPQNLEALDLAYLDGGELPDVLAEVKYELDWLLKMQVPELDGRVSHKFTTEFFASGTALPEEITAPRYFAAHSTSAAATFAAVMAQAARVYEPYDGDFAGECLEAALRSYDYLVDNPDEDVESFFGRTGLYNSSASDDRAWAAAEVWRTTGSEDALADFEQRAQDAAYPVNPTFDWSNLWTLAILTYVYADGDLAGERDPDVVSELETHLVARADDMLLGPSRNYAYGRSIGRFLWGSNGEHLRTCMILRAADWIESDPAYGDACEAIVGNVFGHNRYGRSLVTGVGHGPPLHPHHRLSEGDDVCRPYPGLIAGGINEGRQWVDTFDDFFTNEVAINWNAALVYALAGFVSPERIDTSEPGEPPQSCDEVVSAAPHPAAVPSAGSSGAGGAGAEDDADAGVGGAGAGAVPEPDDFQRRSSGCGCVLARGTARARGLAASLLGVVWVVVAGLRRTREETPRV